MNDLDRVWRYVTGIKHENYKDLRQCSGFYGAGLGGAWDSQGRGGSKSLSPKLGCC